MIGREIQEDPADSVQGKEEGDKPRRRRLRYHLNQIRLRILNDRFLIVLTLITVGLGAVIIFLARIGYREYYRNKKLKKL